MKTLLEINFNYRTHCQCCHRQGSSSFHVDTQLMPDGPSAKRKFVGHALGTIVKAHAFSASNDLTSLPSPHQSRPSEKTSMSLASIDGHLRARQLPAELSTERVVAELPDAATNCTRNTTIHQRAELPETTVENPRRRSSLRKMIAEIVSRSIRPGKHTERQSDAPSTVASEMHDDPVAQIEAFVAELEDTSSFVVPHPSHSSDCHNSTTRQIDDHDLSGILHAGSLSDRPAQDLSTSESSISKDILDDPFGAAGVPQLSRRTTLESDDEGDDEVAAQSPISPMDAGIAIADVGFGSELHDVSPIEVDNDFLLLDMAGMSADYLQNPFDSYDMELFGPSRTKARALVDDIGYGHLHSGMNDPASHYSRQTPDNHFDGLELYLKELSFPQSWSGLMANNVMGMDPSFPVLLSSPPGGKKKSSIAQSMRRHIQKPRYRPLQPKPQVVEPDSYRPVAEPAIGDTNDQGDVNAQVRTGKRKRSSSRPDRESNPPQPLSSNGSAKCDNCGREFMNSEGAAGRIARHKKRSCPMRENPDSAQESTRARCPVCPKMYARPDGLLNHLREKHFDHPDVSLPAPRRYNVKGIVVSMANLDEPEEETLSPAV